MQISTNIITYLDRTFKEEQNDINFKMKYFYQIGVNFNFIYQVSGAQTPTKMLTGTMHKRIH